MEDLKEEVSRILSQECPISRVNQLINTIEVNKSNIEVINEAINFLEMHESEIRRVRQLLMLKTRDHYFKELKMKKK